jgi:DNA-directed RNA polymerase specialized sigma24 family protein
LLVDKLEYQKIVLAITTIPSPYSEVLYLHFVKDFSIKKTASFLERKSTTVKMQLVRGKRILIERLSEVPYE